MGARRVAVLASWRGSEKKKLVPIRENPQPWAE